MFYSYVSLPEDIYITHPSVAPRYKALIVIIGGYLRTNDDGMAVADATLLEVLSYPGRPNAAGFYNPYINIYKPP